MKTVAAFALALLAVPLAASAGVNRPGSGVAVTLQAFEASWTGADGLPASTSAQATPGQPASFEIKSGMESFRFTVRLQKGPRTEMVISTMVDGKTVEMSRGELSSDSKTPLSGPAIPAGIARLHPVISYKGEILSDLPVSIR